MADPTKQQWGRMPILGGINQLDSEDALQPGQVSDAENFLFEQGRVFTRPGVASHSIENLTGRVVLHKAFATEGGMTYNNSLLVTDDTKVWSLAPNGVIGSSAFLATLLTNTVAFNFGGRFNPDAISLNGVIVFTVGGAFLYRWDFLNADPVTTIGSPAGHAYITSINSRVVGAVDLNGGSPLFTKIGWSASGDETNWSTSDAGSLTLSDTFDPITGLGTIHNVVVVLRAHGIHLGTLTGVSLPVFRFENYVRRGAGCFFEGTAAFDDDFCMYVGADDVYKFSLGSKPEPIGGELRQLILQTLASFYRGNERFYYRGYFTRSGVLQSGEFGGVVKPRYRYHLSPSWRVSAQPFMDQYPHFVYDLQEDKWSVHTYGFISTYGTSLDLVPNHFVPAIFDNSTNSKVYVWDPQLPQENGARLSGPVITVENPEYDMRVNRALIRYRDVGPTQVTMRLEATRENAVVGSVDTQKFGNDPPTGRWMRQYFNHELVGQDFKWTMEVPPGVPFETNTISLRYSRAGEFKGVMS